MPILKSYSLGYFMSLYYVLDTCAQTQQVALYDSFGAHHLARAVSTIPAIGAELHGGRPSLGVNVLHASFTDEPFAMDFELIDCSRADAISRLRGPVAAADEAVHAAWPPTARCGAISSSIGRR